MHFSLLVPPILALIDDEGPVYKALGCQLLSRLLIPVRQSGSDILQRTNLSSVFEEAVAPCLLSLPTITSEEESLELLRVAYPALLSLLKTSHLKPPPGATNHELRRPFSSRQQRKQADAHLYTGKVTKILRTELIPSFHHISSGTPAAVSSFASFPYPELSSFMLSQVTIMVHEIGINSAKYLQELIPLTYSVLVNPFGTSYIPLLLSAITATTTVILNSHPRIWRWRGEVLGSVCSCWIHALEEEKRVAESEPTVQERNGYGRASRELKKLKKHLKGVLYLLKFALLNPIAVEDRLDAGQLDAMENIDRELHELVNADDALEDLLLSDIDPADAHEFF